jgi:DNA-binding transcriptional MerR regulator
MEISIGELSRRSSVKVSTIRFYESIDLVPPPARTDGKQRRYGAEAVKRLNFIRHARELGFEVEAIRQLLDTARDPARACGEAHEITRRHLAEVNDKIERLTALRDELEAMLTCDTGRVSECRIIEVLADHTKCQHQEHGRGAV